MGSFPPFGGLGQQPSSYVPPPPPPPVFGLTYTSAAELARHTGTHDDPIELPSLGSISKVIGALVLGASIVIASVCHTAVGRKVSALMHASPSDIWRSIGFSRRAEEPATVPLTATIPVERHHLDQSIIHDATTLHHSRSYTKDLQAIGAGLQQRDQGLLRQLAAADPQSAQEEARQLKRLDDNYVAYLNAYSPALANSHGHGKVFEGARSAAQTIEDKETALADSLNRPAGQAANEPHQ